MLSKVSSSRLFEKITLSKLTFLEKSTLSKVKNERFFKMN
jgi:hypothetical protein